jgi:hypothetical protein
MKGRNLRVLLVAGAISTGLHAGEVRPVAHIAAEFGGDTLVVGNFTDGTTRSIDANQRIALGGGASWVNDAKNMEVEASLAYKFTTINASNGSISWTRFPLDVLVFRRWEQFRVGAGLTYHINPRLKGIGVAGDANVKFDNALGAIVQADWLFANGFNLGLRYTKLDYEEVNLGTKANSDGVGVILGYRFER